MAIGRSGEPIEAYVVGYADVEAKEPATPDTEYLTYSITKSITSIAVHQLLERGVVHLDDDIHGYVPGSPSGDKPITIGHLLSNTSGIRQFRNKDAREASGGNYSTLAETLILFQDDPLEFEPGTGYEYTSLGYNLLSGVIESASSTDYESYLEREIFEPAGMTHTAIFSPDVPRAGLAEAYRRSKFRRRLERIESVPSLGWCSASAAVLSTPTDLVRLVQSLRGKELLRASTIDEMFAIAYPELNETQAFGWNRRVDGRNRPVVFQSGRGVGYSGLLVHYPEDEVTAALLVNSAQFPDRLEFLAELVAPYLEGARTR